MHKAVYRTAPAPPGLLLNGIIVLSYLAVPWAFFHILCSGVRKLDFPRSWRRLGATTVQGTRYKVLIDYFPNKYTLRFSERFFAMNTYPGSTVGRGASQFKTLSCHLNYHYFVFDVLVEQKNPHNYVA